MYNLGLASRMKIHFLPFIIYVLSIGYETKLIRITTVSRSLNKLLQGQLKFMNEYFEVIGVSSSGEDLTELRYREKLTPFQLK